MTVSKECLDELHSDVERTGQRMLRADTGTERRMAGYAPLHDPAPKDLHTRIFYLGNSVVEPQKIHG